MGLELDLEERNAHAGVSETDLFKNYLGYQDSNLDRQIQSLQSYR